jgi:hypothetical protein
MTECVLGQMAMRCGSLTVFRMRLVTRWLVRRAVAVHLIAQNDVMRNAERKSGCRQMRC